MTIPLRIPDEVGNRCLRRTMSLAELYPGIMRNLLCQIWSSKMRKCHTGCQTLATKDGAMLRHTGLQFGKDIPMNALVSSHAGSRDVLFGEDSTESECEVGDHGSDEAHPAETELSR